MDHRTAVTAVAKRQHLLITTWQLRLAGVSDEALASRIRHRTWSRAAEGVVALPGEMTPRRRLAAAVLSVSRPEGAALRVEEYVERGLSRAEAMVYAAVGSGQMLCGRSALWLHGIETQHKKPWLRLPVKAAGSIAREGTIVRYGPFTGGLVWIDGLPVVDVEQALMDIPGGRDHPSATWLHHDLTRLIAVADAKRATTVDRLDQRIRAAPRFVGSPALRAAIQDLRGELSHSATEKRARRIAAKVVARYGFTLHPRPYGVEYQGRTVGEADLAVVPIRLDLEIDGPHHRLPDQQNRDRRRDRSMRRARWEVERFSTELIDLFPRRFEAELDECVRARLGLLGLVVPP